MVNILSPNKSGNLTLVPKGNLQKLVAITSSSPNFSNLSQTSRLDAVIHGVESV